MIRMLLLAALALACVCSPALAAADTALQLPYGQWISAGAQLATEILIPVIVTALGVAARRLPWYAAMWFTNERIDRMVRLAAAYALNAVDGATAGKAITVDVGHVVLKAALERALSSSPHWLIEAAGGTQGITERLFRAFHFEAAVTEANTLAPVLRELGVPAAALPRRAF